MKLLGSVVLLLLPGCLPGAQGDWPTLERPSGPYGVGRVGFHWTGEGRPDRFATKPGGHRELMVYLWYPVPAGRVGSRAPYLPGAREFDAVPEVQARLREDFGRHWASVVSGAVAGHALEGAKPATGTAPFPVVIFSHGKGSTGFSYTTLIQDLVSHGYVVASIEHTHVSAAVRFPDGRVVPAREPERPPGLSAAESFEWMMKAASVEIEEGAADIRFVLKRLREPKSLPVGRLDLSRVAAMGHSAGGAFAALACRLDAGFRACVDLDGAMIPVAALPAAPDGAGMKQPLLLLEAHEERMMGTKEQWERYFRTKEQQLQSCAPGTYDVILRSPGIAHPSFSDIPLFFAGAGGYPESAVVRSNHRLIQAFIRAFLDRNLRGRQAPLLEDGSPPHPQATVKRYGGE